jgi:hypothetical protein
MCAGLRAAKLLAAQSTGPRLCVRVVMPDLSIVNTEAARGWAAAEKLVHAFPLSATPLGG